MIASRALVQLAMLAQLFSLGGCNIIPPGKPTVIDLWQSPESNLDFHSLYVTNCIACHADQQGVISSSINLNNSTYLSLVTPEKMHMIVANGVRGTAMPAFSEKSGGRLSDTQINVLINGIYAWKDPKRVSKLPAYSAPLGNVQRGSTVFATYCASCHTKGKTTQEEGLITSKAYLGLVSNQYLRTVIIAGRPEIGQPNWQELSPMSDQDISDVVAWLAEERVANK